MFYEWKIWCGIGWWQSQIQFEWMSIMDCRLRFIQQNVWDMK